MGRQPSDVGVFILAKNEQENIGRCLEALRSSSWDVFVLDSGSTDRTEDIVAGFDFAQFRQYDYTNHCAAYNEITTRLGAGHRYVIVLDADMIVSGSLMQEIDELLSASGRSMQVIEARIEMWIEGIALPFGSLCPPKPFVFAVGKEYFISRGHAEAVNAGVSVTRLKHKLRHDDRKTYASYLQSQVRYAQNLARRAESGQISIRDRIRSASPLLVLGVPFISFFLKGGFLSGRAGAMYALDRLVAEAIMYRLSMAANANDR